MPALFFLLDSFESLDLAPLSERKALIRQFHDAHIVSQVRGGVTAVFHDVIIRGLHCACALEINGVCIHLVRAFEPHIGSEETQIGMEFFLKRTVVVESVGDSRILVVLGRPLPYNLAAFGAGNAA